MIHTINIVTKTRAGDKYREVAINPYPIIYIDDVDVENILQDEDLISIVRKYIKNKATYDNATLCFRTLSDDMMTTTIKTVLLKDKIILEEWI